MSSEVVDSSAAFDHPDGMRNDYQDNSTSTDSLGSRLINVEIKSAAQNNNNNNSKTYSHSSKQTTKEDFPSGFSLRRPFLNQNRSLFDDDPWNDMYSRHSNNHHISDDKWYEDMLRSFDEKQARWEQEIHQRRNEFFGRSHPVRGATGSSIMSTVGPSELSDFRSKITPNQPPVDTQYRRDDNGTVNFVAKFSMPNVELQNVKVTVQGDLLLVNAKRDYSRGGSSHSYEFSRSISLPPRVVESAITASMTDDSVLIINCPLQSPEYPAVAGPYESSYVRGVDVDIHGKPYQPVLGQSSGTTGSFPLTGRPVTVESMQILHPPLVDSLGVVRNNTFHLEVPIGHDYAPEEIQVRTMGQHLYINAKHQEFTNNRTSYREFSKEYDIPAHIDANSVEAQLNNGVLNVTAKSL